MIRGCAMHRICLGVMVLQCLGSRSWASRERDLNDDLHFAVLGLQWLHGTLYIEIIEAEHLPGDPTLVSVRPTSLPRWLLAATKGRVRPADNHESLDLPQISLTIARPDADFAKWLSMQLRDHMLQRLEHRQPLLG